MWGLGAGAMKGRRGRWCGLSKVRAHRVEGLAMRQWVLFVNHGKSRIPRVAMRWCVLYWSSFVRCCVPK